jgi:hypothetical protein
MDRVAPGPTGVQIIIIHKDDYHVLSIPSLFGDDVCEAEYWHPGIYILESGAMGGSGNAGSASDGDKKDSTGTGASRHPDQHGRPGIYIPGSGAMGGCGNAASASYGERQYWDQSI